MGKLLCFQMKLMLLKARTKRCLKSIMITGSLINDWQKCIKNMTKKFLRSFFLMDFLSTLKAK